MVGRSAANRPHLDANSYPGAKLQKCRERQRDVHCGSLRNMQAEEAAGVFTLWGGGRKQP